MVLNNLEYLNHFCGASDEKHKKLRLPSWNLANWNNESLISFYNNSFVDGWMDGGGFILFGRIHRIVNHFGQNLLDNYFISNGRPQIRRTLIG